MFQRVLFKLLSENNETIYLLVNWVWRVGVEFNMDILFKRQENNWTTLLV